MSTPTFCARVCFIFSESSACLGGMTPGCPFRPLGKERGGQTTTQSFGIAALTTLPLSPPARFADRLAAPQLRRSGRKVIRQAALVELGGRGRRPRLQVRFDASAICPSLYVATASISYDREVKPLPRAGMFAEKNGQFLAKPAGP